MNNSNTVTPEDILRLDQLSQPGVNAVKKDKNENEVETKNKNPVAMVHCPRPPKPFKKATYPWQIKNYQFTIEKMTESIKKEIEGIELMRRNPETCGNPSAATDHRELPEMCRGGSGCPLVVATGAVRTPAELQLLQDFTRMGYKQLVEQGSDGSHMDHSGTPTNEAPANGDDSDQNERSFSILTWHTRQLCRSIFDTTVHRMLEKMNYIIPQHTNIDPATLYNSTTITSDKITQEQADQIAIQNSAVTAALQRKYILESQFSYDQIESATSSDYDSSEEEDTEEDLEPLYEASSEKETKKNTSPMNLTMEESKPPRSDSKDRSPRNLCDAQNDCDVSAKPTLSPPGKRNSDPDDRELSESKRFKSESPVARSSPTSTDKADSCASSPLGVEGEFISTNSSSDSEANGLVISSPIKFGLKQDLAFQEA